VNGRSQTSVTISSANDTLRSNESTSEENDPVDDDVVYTESSSSSVNEVLFVLHNEICPLAGTNNYQMRIMQLLLLTVVVSGFVWIYIHHDYYQNVVVANLVFVMRLLFLVQPLLSWSLLRIFH
jgi:hypothetical protein